MTGSERQSTFDIGAANARRVMSESLQFIKSRTPANDVAPEAIQTIDPVRIAPQPAAVNPGMGPSVISVSVEVTGSIAAPDALQVYGVINGNVRAQMLTVCEGGIVKGDIAAETVIIKGVVEGRIYGQKVQLLAGAVVKGDIVHAQLGIDTDAVFEGASKRTQNPLAEVAKAA